MNKLEQLEKELAEYGLEIRWADWENPEPIDFDISDGNDNVAWVWGKTPDDIQVECNHPVAEFEDYDDRGVCPLCGNTCDWHKVQDEEPYPEPHEWYGNSTGGIIKEIVEEVYDNQRREQ